MNLELPPTLFERFAKLPIIQEQLAAWKREARKLHDDAVAKLAALRASRERDVAPLLEARAKAQAALEKAERELEKKKAALASVEAGLASTNNSAEAAERRLRAKIREHQGSAVDDFIRRCHRRRDRLNLMEPGYSVAKRDALKNPNRENLLVRDYSGLQEACMALFNAITAAEELRFTCKSADLDAELEALEKDLPPLARSN